jgi:thiol-disulfide isomerase/thioredoxin
MKIALSFLGVLFVFSVMLTGALYSKDEQKLSFEQDNVRLTNLETGGQLSLRDLRGENVMLHFWATWCVPCKKDLQEINKLYEGLSRHMTIIAITDEDPVSVAEAWKEWQVQLPVYLDSTGKLGESFEIRIIPANVFIDRTGKVFRKVFGTADWKSLLEVLERPCGIKKATLILQGETRKERRHG